MKLQEIWICRKCGFRSELGKLKNPHSDINICPQCKDVLLRPLKVFEKQELKSKLARHLFCLDCEFAGLIEDFPFKSGHPNGDPEDAGDERYCPKCMSDRLISASELNMCDQCGERPAEEGDTWWCQGCTEAYEAASKTESDFDPFD